MNLFRLSSLLCGAMLLLFAACTPPYVEEEPIGMDTYPRRFFFNTILEPKEVHMARPNRVDFNTPEYINQIQQGRAIEVYLTGTSYSNYGRWSANTGSATEPKSFASLASAIGDGNYYGYKYPLGAVSYEHTLTSGIRSLSLTAVGGYSATYPAGSDLAPITQAYWVQVERKANRSVTQGELDRIWQAYGTNVQPPFDAFVRTTRTAPLVELKGIALPAVNRGQEPMEAVHGARTGVVCYLVLKELPEQGEQTLRLTLTLMDGRELTREATLSLGN